MYNLKTQYENFSLRVLRFDFVTCRQSFQVLLEVWLGLKLARSTFKADNTLLCETFQSYGKLSYLLHSRSTSMGTSKHSQVQQRSQCRKARNQSSFPIFLVHPQQLFQQQSFARQAELDIRSVAQTTLLFQPFRREGCDRFNVYQQLFYTKVSLPLLACICVSKIPQQTRDSVKRMSINHYNKKNIRYSLLAPAWKSAQTCICLNYLP